MNHPSLIQLINNGWIIHLRGLVPISEAPLAEDKIEELKKATSNKVTHIVFLNQGVGGKGTYYPICSETELKLAHQEIQKSNEIIGYSLAVTCRASCLRGEIEINDYAKNLGDLTGWEIDVENPKQFRVWFVVEGDSKEQGYKFINELEYYLACFSINNKVGVKPVNITWATRYRAQPFGLHAGTPESSYKGVTKEDFDRFVRLRDGVSDKLISDLLDFYSQISSRTKLITGFSILEALFDSGAEHILSKPEVDLLLLKVSEIESISLDGRKVGRLTDALKSPSIMSKLNRNERLAVKLSEVMNLEYGEAYKKIKELSKYRGKAAHSVAKNKPEFEASSDYIEQVLLKLVYGGK